MAVIAVYSVKGGVGKSTMAAALAWSSASISRRHTLLWDLDVQGAAAFLLGEEHPQGTRAAAVFTRDLDPEKLALHTRWDRLDLLPSDDSLREIDGLFARLGKRRRLGKLTDALAKHYERIVLDCPPVLNELSNQVIRAADIIVVPLPPSPLSRRALDTIREELSRNHKHHPPLLPVLSMVDMRRKLHRDTVAEMKGWPIVPMSSQIEQMAARRVPIGAFAPASPAAQAIARVWTGIERKLCE